MIANGMLKKERQTNQKMGNFPQANSEHTQTALFFGFPVEGLFALAFQSVSLEMRALFIRPEGDFLRQHTRKGVLYLGKEVDSITNLADLELLQNHIYSVLKKLLPDYPCTSTPLLLFAYPKENSWKI